MSTPDTTAEALTIALARADELDDALMRAIDVDHFRPYDASDRISASVSAAAVALAHGRAVRVLVAEGLPTSALSLMRLQHEALVRAFWLLYAANDLAISKLSAPLTKEAESAAGKLPMMAEMLKQLSSHPAAAQALIGLLAFKDNNAAALNSFVHGGIHALQRQAQGYPVPLIVGALRNCNGLMVMAAMMLAVLTGRQALVHAVAKLQATFADELPLVSPHASLGQQHAPTAPPTGGATQDLKNSSY
ncbi:MAG: hypothetical protein RI907_717 [Pseudomonadota bacterium]|jgi:hypothetical protein